MSRLGILDASAVLAYLRGEAGQDRVARCMEESSCQMTTVNTCEVLGKLCDLGMPAEQAEAAFDDLRITAVNFDADLARRAAFLRIQTKPIGASLGDRACLALAQQAAEAQSPVAVYTAERSWAKLKWPFKVVIIR